MAINWRERLGSLRGRFSGKSAAEPVAETSSRVAQANASERPRDQAARGVGNSSSTARSAETVAINLGIDFGTSFTKVCFRDVGTEESSIITFDEQTLANALIPTIVAVDDDGRLHLDGPAGSGATTRVPFLKMRLAGSHLGESLRSVRGIDLNSDAAARALSSWFLASIIKRSQEWIGRNEGSRLKNRTPMWSANVGVPVEYCDSDAIKIFDEVLGVSWLWLTTGAVPKTLSEALTAYERNVRDVRDKPIDFHAVPEIAAAVQSFVISREAVPGIYVHFDIGGGTVDGVAFNLVNMSGARRINFYSGKVGKLGISALAGALGTPEGTDQGSKLVEQIVHAANQEAVEGFAQELRQLVGHVVFRAKIKDGRDWRRDVFQGGPFERKFLGTLDTSRMVPLVVFLGGGGAQSEWYRDTIGSTYEKFGHSKAGIPPYKLLEVRKPTDLSMRGLPDAEFGRFAIAYGLSVPFGEGPDVGLPSQFGPAEDSPRWRPPGSVVDYADSKDVYD